MRSEDLSRTIADEAAVTFREESHPRDLLEGVETTYEGLFRGETEDLPEGAGGNTSCWLYALSCLLIKLSDGHAPKTPIQRKILIREMAGTQVPKKRIPLSNPKHSFEFKRFSLGLIASGKGQLTCRKFFSSGSIVPNRVWCSINGSGSFPTSGGSWSRGSTAVSEAAILRLPSLPGPV